MSLLIRGGLVVTMNDAFEVLEGDVSIRDGRIAAIASNIIAPHDRVVDARGGYVLPGLIQTHIHLCQTLFRGFADDLPLMDWLRKRVWPMEAAHTPLSRRASRSPARAICWRKSPASRAGTARWSTRTRPSRKTRSRS